MDTFGRCGRQCACLLQGLCFEHDRTLESRLYSYQLTGGLRLLQTLVEGSRFHHEFPVLLHKPLRSMTPLSVSSILCLLGVEFLTDAQDAKPKR